MINIMKLLRMITLTKLSQDIRYLKPYVDQAAKEDQERAEWDTITVVKAHH